MIEAITDRLRSNPTLLTLALIAVFLFGPVGYVLIWDNFVAASTAAFDTSIPPPPTRPEAPWLCAAGQQPACLKTVSAVSGIVVRACTPPVEARPSACISAPLAYLRIPAAEPWRTRAGELLKQVLGSGLEAQCATVGEPTSALSCQFREDVQAALLADGLAVLDQAGCEAATDKDKARCRELAAVQADGQWQRRGIWWEGRPAGDMLAAVNRREVAASMDQARATVMATAVTAAAALCAAIWYLVYGGAEGFAKYCAYKRHLRQIMTIVLQVRSNDDANLDLALEVVKKIEDAAAHTALNQRLVEMQRAKGTGELNAARRNIVATIKKLGSG